MSLDELRSPQPYYLVLDVDDSSVFAKFEQYEEAKFSNHALDLGLVTRNSALYWQES